MCPSSEFHWPMGVYVRLLWLHGYMLHWQPYIKSSLLIQILTSDCRAWTDDANNIMSSAYKNIHLQWIKMVSLGLRPTPLLLFLLHELSVFIVMLHRNVFIFYVLFNSILLLSYSVSWPPSWNKYLLTVDDNKIVQKGTLANWSKISVQGILPSIFSYKVINRWGMLDQL